MSPKSPQAGGVNAGVTGKPGTVEPGSGIDKCPYCLRFKNALNDIYDIIEKPSKLFTGMHKALVEALEIIKKEVNNVRD